MTIAMGTNGATNWGTRRNDSHLSRAGATIGRRLAAGLKAVQYAQMVAVMNRLPDDFLDKAGLRRADIPDHARQAIYGDETDDAR